MVQYDKDTDIWIAAEMKIPVKNTAGNLLVGSPEWFREKSRIPEIMRDNEQAELLRTEFENRYKPEVLMSYDGKKLLSLLFDADDGMLRTLTLDETYRQFGAGSKFAYLWPIRYWPKTGESCYYEKSKAYPMNYETAIKKAEEVRDNLCKCCSWITETGDFTTVGDYENLYKKLKTVPFGTFPWALKYFRMIYPSVFPQMYADHIILRVLDIVGLEKHGNNRLKNMGEIALFEHECGISSYEFSKVYSWQWGWDGNPGPSEYALSKTKKRVLN